MRTINTYINEKLVIGDNLYKEYNYYPKDKYELIEILKNKLSLHKNADLNDIDTSQITNMAKLFDGLDPYNIDISKWDVSNVTNMNSMFYNCTNFNCDLSDWDVSNVEDMGYMFTYCTKLDCNLQNWKINKTCIKTYMFYRCDNMTIPTWYKKNIY